MKQKLEKKINRIREDASEYLEYLENRQENFFQTRIALVSFGSAIVVGISAGLIGNAIHTHLYSIGGWKYLLAILFTAFLIIYLFFVIYNMDRVVAREDRENDSKINDIKARLRELDNIEKQVNKQDNK